MKIKLFTLIKERILWHKNLGITAFNDKNVYNEDMGFFIMAFTHIKHHKYKFDEIRFSYKSNSIYLYKKDNQVKRISDHYNGYGMMHEDYLSNQGVILKTK